MSGYQGRRAPNVSQYLAELNTVPTSQEIAAQSQAAGLEMDHDLALFTNTEFFDFDMGDLPEFNPAVDYDPAQEERTRRQNASAYKQSSRDFQFQNFPNFPDVVSDPSSSGLPLAQSNGYQLPNQTSPVSASPLSPKVGDFADEKRKLDAIGGSMNPSATEDVARVAAEEDKRRRNTAASARFRVKKKQREQALEKTAKEMTEKVSMLEAKVTQLETENKWLKNLLTEKHEKKSSEIAELFKKNAEDGSDARSTSERTDGVGTTGKANKA